MTYLMCSGAWVQIRKHKKIEMKVRLGFESILIPKSLHQKDVEKCLNNSFHGEDTIFSYLNEIWNRNRVSTFKNIYHSEIQFVPI